MRASSHTFCLLEKVNLVVFKCSLAKSGACDKAKESSERGFTFSIITAKLSMSLRKCWSGGIRTHHSLTPSQVRYRAALHCRRVLFEREQAMARITNPRPLDPQSSALPGCATLRTRKEPYIIGT